MLFDVMPFKRVGVTPVFLSAGGIPDMSDGGPSRVFRHEFRERLLFGRLKHFGNDAGVFIRVDQLVSERCVSRKTRRKLPAILEIKQHAGNEYGNGLSPLSGTKTRRFSAGKMINRRHTTLLVEFTRWIGKRCHQDCLQVSWKKQVLQSVTIVQILPKTGGVSTHSHSTVAGGLDVMS